MRRIKAAGWFFICWFSIAAFTGIWKYLNLPPSGIHQGAQADRACIAWNFYDQSMNFFKPRVMETRMNDGIAGMEFPVVNYTAALLYKIFGPREVIYRLLVFCIVTMGAFAAWLITGFFIQRNLNRMLLVAAWFLSPILFYYSVSFIPDASALAFGMVAMYFMLRYYYGIQTKRSITWYLVFISLAGLIKITFLILHVVALVILISDKKKTTPAPANIFALKREFLYAIVPLLPVAAWYSWSRWLTNQTGNIHFLQQINPAKNLQEFSNYTSYSFNTWNDSVYSKNMIYILPLLFVISFASRRKETPLTASLAMLSLLGAGCAYLLFQFQFLYHDYYMLIFFPAFFFMLLFLQQTYLEGKKFFIGLLPLVVLIAFYALPVMQLFHTRDMLTRRNSPGDYFYQEAFAEQKYYRNIHSAIDSFIPKKARIISIYDPTPNTSLYFLRRQGIRVASDFSPELTAEILANKNLHYLVLNDSMRFEKELQPVLRWKKTLLYRKDIISVWKLEYRP